jgi:hypothetical protein
MVTSNQATTHPPTIRAVLTHKPLNLKAKPDPKPKEDCQIEPQTSTGEAEEGDRTFDAVAMVTRVDSDGDVEEHEHPSPLKGA